jgi:hypothetical protein
VTAPEPGRVLRWALIGWGFGHLLLGRRIAGWAWLIAELIALGILIWLSIGLIDSSAYLVPFLAGVAFLVAWAWQAIDAYRTARRGQPSPALASRSPAAAIGWLSLPLLVWGTGFWVVAARSATPAAVVDRFVREWTAGQLSSEWGAGVVRAAERAADAVAGGDLRSVIVDRGHGAFQPPGEATVVIERIHYERREATFLGVFPGSELVAVTDAAILGLVLRAEPVELLGGGDIGAVRWTIATAEASD